MYWSWWICYSDKISAGDVLLVVESDKADMDVESFDDGFGKFAGSLGNVALVDCKYF